MAGEPVGQIAYHDRQGRLTGFCIKANTPDAPAPLTPSQFGGELQMISWAGRGFQYVLVGFEDVEVLQPIAERLAERYGKDV